MGYDIYKIRYSKYDRNNGFTVAVKREVSCWTTIGALLWVLVNSEDHFGRHIFSGA
jgi:hypothetical protein